MALPTQPFAGGGGYGPTMAPGYMEMAAREAERITQERNQRNDAAFNAVGGLVGRGAGMDPGMVNAMFPSAMSQYYAQSSELDKKSNAMKKMLELNPDMFGLNQEQAKQLGDVTSKMSSTERSAFFQNYVPTLFKAQQSNLERQFATQKALAAQKPPLDLSGLNTAIDSIWNLKPTGSQTPAAVVPVDQSMQGQDTTQPATDLANFIRRRLGYIPSVIPPALMAEYNALTGQ
jgi:hypothetical protein